MPRPGPWPANFTGNITAIPTPAGGSSGSTRDGMGPALRACLLPIRSGSRSLADWQLPAKKVGTFCPVCLSDDRRIRWYCEVLWQLFHYGGFAVGICAGWQESQLL